MRVSRISAVDVFTRTHRYARIRLTEEQLTYLQQSIHSQRQKTWTTYGLFMEQATRKTKPLGLVS